MWRLGPAGNSGVCHQSGGTWPLADSAGAHWRPAQPHIPRGSPKALATPPGLEVAAAAAAPLAAPHPPVSEATRPSRCDAAPPATCSRRRLLLLSGAVLAPAALLHGTGDGALPAHADAAEDASFYATWPYVSPSDILPYLRETATPGDIDSVLAAIDAFAAYYPMYRCGPEKGAILEQLVAKQQPQLAVELGTFMGYGTARIARQLPPGGRVISIEASPEQATVARAVLEFAGLPVGDGPDAPVQVVSGLSADVLPRLRREAGLSAGQAAGFVFLDHCKQCYLPDLRSMEALSLVAPGTLVLADNVVVPGAPNYLEYVGGARGFGGSSSGSSSVSSSSGSSSGAVQLTYHTELVESMFEVDQQYKQDWQPQQDAMSVSMCLQAEPQGQ